MPNNIPEGWTIETPKGEPALPAAVESQLRQSATEPWQTIDDAGRAAANAVSFGMADRFAGAMSGTGTGEQVKLSEAAHERSPYASAVGEVGGSAMIPGIGGRQAAAKLADKLPGWLARGVGHGGEGAVLGGLQGAGNTYTGNPVDYLTNAGKGVGMGGILGFGFGSAFGPRGGYTSTAKTPSNAELRIEKNANYRDLGQSKALYESGHLAGAADPVEAALRAERFHQSRSPVTFQALEEMRAPPTTAHLGQGVPVSPADIDFIRKGITTNIDPLANATDAKSAKAVKKALDDFVLNPPQGAVLPGTEAAAAEASALANRARGNYGGLKRGTALDSVIENATTATGAAHSGLNLENTLKQHVKSFVRQDKDGNSPASKAGYNEEEIAALKDYARGRLAHNIQRYVGNALGGGGGLAVPVIGAVGTQYFRDNPTEGAVAGGLATGAGLATRIMGNRRALRDINSLSDMVRQRTPLYQERAATAPLAPPPSGRTVEQIRNAIAQKLVPTPSYTEGDNLPYYQQ